MTTLRRHSFLLVLILIASSWPVCGQDIDVTFRWLPTQGDGVVRAFLPGEFNGWGPNSGGLIAPNAASLMTYDQDSDQWQYTARLRANQTYQYKIHLHYNASGQANSWISDPLNDRINTNDHNNSVVTIRDPMVFQMARRRNAAGLITEVSAGVFGSEAITALTFELNGESHDGMPYYDNGVFRYVLPEASACGLQFNLTAEDTLGRVASDEMGVTPPVVTDATRPDGLQDGITYAAQNPARATLSLFAPGKCFVHVIGDFNDWQPNDAYLMKRDAARPDSVHWWLELDGLGPGTEYAFQYLVDGELRIVDMFSEKVLDPTHDAQISELTYPDLKPYPTGKTQGMVSVLQTSPEEYTWTTADFTPPPQSELVIYELLVRDFVGAHDYATLIDTLGYLETLGVNAIELMPVAEFAGNANWGYQPQFYFAPDKAYGPARDLQRFVDAAHARGIAVILDVVYNHVDIPSPLVTLYGAANSNPWINIPPRHTYNVFFDLNHEHPYTQYWLDRANAYWLSKYRVDGFRFDLSKGITQRNTHSNPGAWGAYDPSRIALLTRMADHIWTVNPKAYVILEHFGGEREERELAAHGMARGLPGMMVWNNVNHPFAEAVMGYHTGGRSDISRAYYGPGGRAWELPHVISYMESHDEQWLMYSMLRYGACDASPTGGAACGDQRSTYNVRRLPVALDRLKMAGAFFFLLPGPRMMWQFGELGYGYGERGEQCLRPGACPSFAPSRTGSKPIRWDYRVDPLRVKLYDTWSHLLALRRHHPVFRSTDTRVAIQGAGPVKRVRLSHPTMEVEIIGNFGVRPEPNRTNLTTPPQFWYDYFSGDSLDVTGTQAAALEPGEFHVYTNKRLAPPPSGLITVSAEPPEPAGPALALEQNYPNPFTRATDIRFTLPDPGPVRLEVFDVLGRRVAVLVDADHLPPQAHTVTFEPRHLPSGLYIYRLQAGSRVVARAMMHRP